MAGSQDTHDDKGAGEAGGRRLTVAETAGAKPSDAMDIPEPAAAGSPTPPCAVQRALILQVLSHVTVMLLCGI